MIIAVVGMCGSGKSTVCEYLAKLGVPGVYFGQVTMDWLKTQGLEVTPANEKKARLTIRKKHGMGAFATLALPQIKKYLAEYKNIFIDGLYSTEEYEILLNTLSPATLLVAPPSQKSTVEKKFKSEKIIIVEVYSDKALRYDRIQSRKVRPFSLAECIERDWNEIKFLNKGGPIAMSDYKIPNQENTSTLYIAVDGLLKKIGVVK